MRRRRRTPRLLRDEDAHVLGSHRIATIPRKFFEIEDGLGDGRLELEAA